MSSGKQVRRHASPCSLPYHSQGKDGSASVLVGLTVREEALYASVV